MWKIYTYMPHMKLLVLTMYQRVLYLYLTNITETNDYHTQPICYMGIQNQHFCTCMQKYNQLQHLFNMLLPNIWQMYMYISSLNEVTGINHAKRSVYIFDISLKKYSCNIRNIIYTLNILNGHLDPKVLHIYAKTQLTATATSCYCQVYSRNKYSCQIGHICNLHQISDGHIWEMYVHVYSTYEVTAINLSTRDALQRQCQ